MPFENQISITGATGVGSTSLLNALKKQLPREPYRWFSAGSLFREKAASLGMSVDLFARHCRAHPEEGHDLWVDERIKSEAQADYMICESRLSHFFMPEAFKVLLICSMAARAVRRHRDNPGMSLPGVLTMIKERDLNDTARYEKLYPGCIWRAKQFDLILSSDEKENGGQGPPEALAHLLLERHKRWLALRRSAQAKV